MITPQLTEQYGQIERVSVARAIFSSRMWAWGGARSKPSPVAPAPPTAPIFRKSLRERFIRPTSSTRRGVTENEVDLAVRLPPDGGADQRPHGGGLSEGSRTGLRGVRWKELWPVYHREGNVYKTLDVSGPSQEAPQHS